MAIAHAERLEKGHPFRQWKTWTLPGTQLTVSGYSRSNDKTFFHLPSLKCSFDAGLCEGRQVDTIFLTHTHDDHVDDLAFLAGRPTGIDLYAPAEATPYIERFLAAKRELNHMAPFDPAKAGTGLRHHAVQDGMEFEFGPRGRFQVKVVACSHKIPCVGYAFSERKTRFLPECEALKQELAAQGRMKEFGERMAEKRKAGVAVSEEVLEPAWAFLGDTHPRVYTQSPWLLRYPVVFTECTYLDDKELERAELVGHTVWSKLRPVVQANPKTLFVLTHFSLRHSDSEVVAFFQKEAEQHGLSNVVVWAHPESALPEQHQAAR